VNPDEALKSAAELAFGFFGLLRAGTDHGHLPPLPKRTPGDTLSEPDEA